MKKGRIHGILIALLVLAPLAMWWWAGRAGPQPAPSVPSPVERASDTPASSGLERYARRGEALTAAAPPSWRGTEPDGALAEDARGNLVIDEALRRRFDYFLSALGEEDLDTLKARLAAHFRAHLSAPAAAQAWALLERYLGYRQELATLSPPGQDPRALRHSLEQRQALRARFFDASTAEAFFGFQDRYAEFALDRRAILEDEALDEATKKGRLEALEATLPAELQAQVKASHEPSAVRREVEDMRAAGVSDAEIDRLREARLGREAADRLAALDQQRARWRGRYQDYAQQRQGILDSGLAEADQQEEIRRLRERLFEAAELRRVEALDRQSDPRP